MSTKKLFLGLAALALTISGCGDKNSTEADPTPTQAPTQAPASASPAQDSTPTEQPPLDPGRGDGQTGEAGGATPMQATEKLLAWEETGQVASTPTVVQANDFGNFFLTAKGPRKALLTGPETHVPVQTPGDITQLLQDEKLAVVVYLVGEGTAGVVIDKVTGDTRRIPKASDRSGGWLLVDDAIAYPVDGAGGEYCLAPVGTEDSFYCAKPNTGYTGATFGTGGLALMSFDAAKPSCRTLLTLSGGAKPVPGVPKCQGWDVAALKHGTVWSFLQDENRADNATFRAGVGQNTFDLGDGDARSLTPCGDSAFFTRPGTSKQPAQVLRWTPSNELQIAYAAPKPGFGAITGLVCAAGTLTVSLQAESGDSQVFAPVK